MSYVSRWGRFHLDGHMLSAVRGDPDGEIFKQLVALMGQILVVQAQHCAYSDRIEYLGISPLFDVLEEGALAPEYELEGQSFHEEQPDGTTRHRYEVKAFRRMNRCSSCWNPLPVLKWEPRR